MESLAIFHREVNPRRQETAGEVSRCSRTPAHPGKKNKTITTLSATSMIQSPFPNNKLTSTSTFKLRTCIQRSPRFMYSLQIFSLQPLFTTTLSMPLRNLKLSRVLGRCSIQFTEDLSKLLWQQRANPPLLGPTCRPEPLQAGGCWVSWSRAPLWTQPFQWRWAFREYPVETRHRQPGYKRTPSAFSRFLSPRHGAAAVVSGADAFAVPHPLSSAFSFISPPAPFLSSFDSLHNIINIAHLHFQ